MNIKTLIPAFATLAVLVSVMLQNSCANTTQAPSGGSKDTIPPIIVNIKPLPGTVNVPVHNASIRFFFDEYVTVKNPKNIFLSPPQKKAPKYKLKGKSLIVYFDSDLDSNTTYTLDITDAIADNRESNMFPGYTMVFSTGPSLDSMVVTGTVRDCNTLQPINGATVMLYKDLSDSALLKSRPVAAAKTDKWGFFSMRNIADTCYRLYAMADDIGNNIYDPESDKIAFVDSIIRPSLVAYDNLPELLKYDMEDTVHCMARISEYDLYLFRDELSKQSIKNRERTGDRTAFVSFMAPDAQIDSLWIRNIPQNRLIMEFNPTRDSLLIWVNDRRRPLDTLHLFVDYMKSDSAGVLVPATEHFRLPRPGGKYRRPSLASLKHEDTICRLKLTAESNTIERKGFSLAFDFPIITEGFGEMTLTSTNPRQQKNDVLFTVERDSANLRQFWIKIDEKMQQGYDYTLKIPHRKFMDINGYYNDSTECRISLPKDDKLSQLLFNLSNVQYRYIVDLLTEKMDKILDSYSVTSDGPIIFPYLKSGKYCIRLTQDLNANGRVDTGNLFEHRQPEKVKFYTLKNGSHVVNLPEGTDMEQNIDVATMFEK